MRYLLRRLEWWEIWASTHYGYKQTPTTWIPAVRTLWTRPTHRPTFLCWTWGYSSRRTVPRDFPGGLSLWTWILSYRLTRDREATVSLRDSPPLYWNASSIRTDCPLSNCHLTAISPSWNQVKIASNPMYRSHRLQNISVIILQCRGLSCEVLKLTDGITPRLDIESLNLIASMLFMNLFVTSKVATLSPSFKWIPL